jgi:hypothetical protein
MKRGNTYNTLTFRHNEDHRGEEIGSLEKGNKLENRGDQDGV